jgi:hypothetical protein
MAKTSPTMRAALAAMREAGGLEYRTGGWWVRKGTPCTRAALSART